MYRAKMAPTGAANIPAMNLPASPPFGLPFASTMFGQGSPKSGGWDPNATNAEAGVHAWGCLGQSAKPESQGAESCKGR